MKDFLRSTRKRVGLYLTITPRCRRELDASKWCLARALIGGERICVCFGSGCSHHEGLSAWQRLISCLFLKPCSSIPWSRQLVVEKPLLFTCFTGRSFPKAVGTPELSTDANLVSPEKWQYVIDCSFQIFFFLLEEADWNCINFSQIILKKIMSRSKHN